MKNLMKSVSRIPGIAALAGVLFMPMMAGEAMAVVCDTTATVCSNGGSPVQCAPDDSNPSLTGYCGNGPVIGTPTQAIWCQKFWPNSACIQQVCMYEGYSMGAATIGCGQMPVPEMSDYMAMAFIALAGGMIYRLRQRVAITGC